MGLCFNEIKAIGSRALEKKDPRSGFVFRIRNMKRESKMESGAWKRSRCKRVVRLR